MAFYFFTEFNKLKVQREEESYGYVKETTNKEVFNLHNQFLIDANAPAFSITKSLIFYQENKLNSNLLNLVLFPVESNFTAGFPIKFFVYRGILKSSILSSSEKIKEADSSWSENNILKVIYENQQKINEKTGEDNVADKSSLGLEFQELNGDVILESILFDYTDSFHPLIIPKGCEIGKFAGGDNHISVEVVMDKIGEDIDLNYLRKNESFLEVNKFSLGSSLSKKEKKKLTFKNRTDREGILAFMDITAFYGACFNQDYKIEGVNNNEVKNLFNKFYNKNTVYLDIRDERGFSFNHFLSSKDSLKLGFYDTEDNIIYEEFDYYNGWPILKLSAQVYKGDKKKFFLKVPISIGMPEVANVITTYTKKVKLEKDTIYKRYMLLGQQDVSGNVKTKESESIKIESWSLNNNKLGANYFLLKLDKITFSDKSDALDKIWNSFFSLKMKNIFKTNDIPEGEFRLKTYSNINAPITVSKGLSKMFSPNIGIVADKYHITLFSFYDELVYDESSSSNGIYNNLIQTGKFNFPFDNSNLEYKDNQAVGFLFQIISNKLKGFELSQFNLSDSENGISSSKFLVPQNNGTNDLDFEDFLDDFHCITLTHEEYNELIKATTVVITDEDFIEEHPYFIKGKFNKKYDYEQFSLLETTLTLGVPKVVSTYDDNYSILITEHPKDVKVNSENITLTSATAN